MMEIVTIQDLVDISSKIAMEKGWADDRTFGDHISLMHSELSEALEEYRNGHTVTDVYYTEANPEKPEGIPIELADVVIRIAMFCGQNGIDLVEALHFKTLYNSTRPFRHGGKKL